jgi:hypothetical protein
MPSRLSSAAIAAALLLIASPALAQSVDAVIHLGGAADGQVPPGGTSAVGLLVPGGASKVAVSVKLEKGSGLDPEFTFVLPDGSVLTPEGLQQAGAKVKASSRGLSVKNLPADQRGLVKVVVRDMGRTGGGYALKVKGKPQKGFKVEGTVATFDGSSDHSLVVGDNAYLSVTLKPTKASALDPTLTVLTDSGFDLDLEPYLQVKKSTTKVKNLPLPFFGGYTIRVGSAAGTGGYALKVKAKTKRRKPDSTLPTADAGGNVVAPPGTLEMFEGSGSQGATLRWEQVSGRPASLSDPASATPVFLAPDETGTRAWQLVAFRGGLASVPDVKVVEVDQPPLAVGGPSRSVDPGAEVTLDGSESFDLDSGAALTHEWRQVAGPAVSLSDPSLPQATFVAPSGSAVLAFELEVSDGVSASIPDRVVVAVGGGRPVADAGRPVVVSRQDSVFLSGARSLGAGGEPPGSFVWSRVDGGPEEIEIDRSDSPWAAFSAPRAVATLRFRLEVGGDVDTADEVVVVVDRNLANRGPRAAAGGIQMVAQGAGFTLSGAGSADPEGAALTHEWLQVSGTTVPLSGAGDSRTGTAPATDAVTRFLLIVHDGLKYGPPDLATVVSGTTPEPVASAGADVSGDPGTSLALSSSAELPPGRTAAAFTWTQVTGLDLFDVAAQDAGFDPSAASPRIEVPGDVSSLTPERALTFTLRVTDDAGTESDEDLVTVTFTNLPTNTSPEVVADASSPTARPGAQVTLMGSAEDVDGDDPLVFRWSQTSGAPVSLGSPGLPNTGFTAPDVSGELVFRLEVDDGTGASNAVGSAAVSVLVNREPQVSARIAPASGPVGTLVMLDASDTVDPDDPDPAFEWTEVDVPPAATPVNLLGGDTATATFSMPAYSGTIAERTRTFEVTVTDSAGSLTRRVTFVPNQAPTIDTISATGSGNVSASTKILYGGTVGASLFAGPSADADGDPVTVSWSIVSGPLTEGSFFSSETGSNVTFSVPKPTATVQSTGGVYTVGATASDGVETSERKTVKVLAYPSWTSDVYSIISANCTASSCHGNATSPAGGLYMGTPSAAHTNLVNGGRVTANDAANSLLFQKVNTGQMPKNASKLSQHLINIISDWIEPDQSGGSSGLSAGAESN